MVEAILAAVGGIVSGIGSMVSSSNARKQNYQDALNAQAPTYTDVFAPYKSETGKNNLLIIGILAGLAVVLTVALMLKNDTR